ncbi:thioredoxin domain-containing protein [Hydrogenovibrio sp. SC-1]|uniref:thioredoxin domain-containing protein n=1 Tax=Hydrogenovibrio sp. SC-1 TaxID=2065820 RepID=UPI001303FDB6|nr:DUF255 domain-containing protein [Hydrogenovibrio sp. SC-1]
MKTHLRLTHQIKPLKKWPGLVIFITLFIGFSSTSWSDAEPPTSSNKLADTTSPYLIMHAQDPVHWQSWQLKILAEAKRQQKPILLSSGYFSCHWCHVMQRENYQDLEVAQFLNQHFISVKIDRELLPDTDQTLINFSRQTAGHAGWPQHVVLTPEGLPFYAFVYLPKAQLLERLERVIALWQSNPKQIRQMAEKVKPKPKSFSPAPLTLDYDRFIKTFNRHLQQQMDDFSGGLKASQKFPNPHILLTLIQQTNPPKDFQAWLKLTLDQMQSQGLYDAVHGGFFRYTIDPNWQSPHFEKMLYTQALLSKLYFMASVYFKDSSYLQTARQTLQYAEQYLWNPSIQLFMSSHSAIDFKQREGGSYLWSRQALQKQLNPMEFKVVTEAWHLSKTPPFELGWLPKRTANHWPEIQAKLQRPPMAFPTDNKSILGWNSLMLSSYATAYQWDRANRDHYLQRAEKLLAGLKAAFDLTPSPRALNSKGKSMGSATLEEYALTNQALADWQNTLINGSPSKRENLDLQSWQTRLLTQAQQQFLTASGWQLSSAPILPGQRNYWAIMDSDLPSATALLDCTRPKHLSQAQAELLVNPLDYASYATTLKCIEEVTH